MSHITSAIPTVLLARIDDEHLVVLGILAFTGVVIYGIYSIRTMIETRSRENTKRELAAYVAEGSLSPEDAQRILSADGSDVEKTIADGVAWGTISPAKAESLIRSLRSDSGKAPAAKPAETTG